MRRCLAALTIAAAIAASGPAAALDPSEPGVWGAIYDPFWAAEGEAAALDRALACLANPVRLEATDEGYDVTTFVLDFAALEAGDLSYLRDYETACRWEPEAAIEQCYDAGDAVYFHTAYREAESQAGVLRAWFLDGRDLEAYFTGGVLPPQDRSYLLFRCAPAATPDAALLETAPRDPAAAEEAFGRIDLNWLECGRPLCGAVAERLLRLAR